MNIKFRLPDWLGDPEFFWQRVSIALTAVTVLMMTVCFQMRADREAGRRQIAELSALTDRQRQTIGQLGGELGQVRTAMADMATRLDELLSASKEQTELATALLNETPEAAVPEQLVTTEIEPPPPAASSEPVLPPKTQTLTADFNHDGIVEWEDFEIFSRHWGKDNKLRMELNDDREVTWKDFQIFAAEWMKTEPWYADKGSG